ncbi:MAG: hypothetical protein ABEK36_04045, partial [Candidatus Aenigmatarchaeota archaeon]
MTSFSIIPNKMQLKAVARILEKVKDKRIIEEFLKYNNTLSIPYRYPTVLSIDKIRLDKDKNTSIVEDSDESRQKKNGKLKREFERQEKIDRELARLLMNKITDRKPDYRELKRQEKCDYVKWAKHIRLMREQDNRKPEKIRKVIEWCQEDQFWQDNILSTSKLREQFDQLELKMRKNSGVDWDNLC